METEHIFDKDLQMKQIEPNTFELNLSDRWSIGTTPNGGYVMAVIANAMIQIAEKKMTPIITASYIARCKPGKALIYLETVADSGSFSRVMARLVQDGEEKVRVFGTFSSVTLLSEVNNECDPEYDGGPPALTPIESSFAMASMGVNSLFDQVDLKLEPSCAEWISGKYSKPMQFKGWISFKDKRQLDIPSILLFADSFPPPVFVGHGLTAWVPTIELSVNIRKIPDTTVLKGVFTSRFISSGLVEEDGELWDSNGDLVALSRQYSLYKKK